MGSPLHQSLTRPILFAGTSPAFLALEVGLGGAMYLSVGPRLPAFLALALLATVVHPLSVWVTSLDPLAPQVYLRSLGQDYYPAHATLFARRLTVHPALPTP